MNYLTILHSGKGIPYAPNTHDDGERNYGFRRLKGRLDAIEDIPEAREDGSLRRLLLAANHATTAVFTAGCLSMPISSEKGFRRTGYVEFVLNDTKAVASAANYFPPFFNFSRLWHQQQGDLNAHLAWEIQPAFFEDLGLSGFTCAVVVNTDFHPSQEIADECWAGCLELLGTLFTSIRLRREGQPIY